MVLTLFCLMAAIVRLTIWDSVPKKDSSTSGEKNSPTLGSEKNKTPTNQERLREDYLLLDKYLEDERLRDADEFTRWLLLQYAGYPDVSMSKEELNRIPCEVIIQIDQLWLKHSSGRFGFSKQIEVFLNFGGKLGEYHGSGSGLEDVWKNFERQIGWNTSYEEASKDFTYQSPEGHLPWKYRDLIEGTANSYVAERFNSCD